MSIPKVILKPRRAQPFYARHPWVYAGAIERIEGELVDGAEVDVHSGAGNRIGRGLYNSASKIAVRLYSWNENEDIDKAFFLSRLRDAVGLRESLGLRGPNKGCRLLFSEGDRLSGLIIDEYSGWLTVQITSLALYQRREVILEAIREVIQPKGVYLRTEKGVGKLEGLEQQDGVIWGEEPPADLQIDENGLKFRVNLAEGQKTGFYVDQRENRTTAARFATGRRVLDAFSYSGGFGLYAARAGALSVDCVDVSEPALELARENAALNGLTNITFTKSDVFGHLKRLSEANEQFGLVILDPPKFARNRAALEDALNGYRRLQTMAVRLLEPGGILVNCCCTGVVTREHLDELLSRISADEKREIQLLGRLGQPADHPISATCWETAYLKGTVSRVV